MACPYQFCLRAEVCKNTNPRPPPYGGRGFSISKFCPRPSPLLPSEDPEFKALSGADAQGQEAQTRPNPKARRLLAQV
jgi:hypothetical protein